MYKINKHIEIVGSTVDRFSCIGPITREKLRVILARRYRSVGISIVNTPADLESLAAKYPDLVFLTMKYIVDEGEYGSESEKIWISEFLETAGIAFTGSPSQAIQFESSKQLAKQRVLDAGLATSKYAIIPRTELSLHQTADLSYPLFVKPTDRGGGSGIDSNSLVTNAAELTTKLHQIQHDLGAEALVEEYLPGREFSVAVIKDTESAYLHAMPIELVATADERGTRMLSKAVKNSNTEEVLEVTEPELRNAVCALARNAFVALGARDYGRIDIRLDAQGQPQFLEANLYPSLADKYGSFPKANALNSDRSYEDMILEIAELGLERATQDEEEYSAFNGEFVTA